MINMDNKKIRQKTKDEYEKDLPNDPYWDCPCDHWDHTECETCRVAFVPLDRIR